MVHLSYCMANGTKHKQHHGTAFAALTITTLFALIYFIFHVTQTGVSKDSLASVFFLPSVTAGELQATSAVADTGIQKIRILIVPGHEPHLGGAEYKNIKERDVTVAIANELKGFLDANPRYETIVTRDQNDWSPTFTAYFKDQWSTIADWVASHHTEMNKLISNGTILKSVGPYHNDAPSDVALRLYAINKWVNENNIDIVIHIHINDYPRSNQNAPGDYSGFAMYVPEHQYSNAVASGEVAKEIFTRLSVFFPVSNLKKESAGVVEDQDLIAVGSYNTVDAVSILIEYGYIYEPVFATGAMQSISTNEMAFQTYLGIQDFFGKPNDVRVSSSTITLPYVWASNLKKYSGKQPAPTPDIFALQIALEKVGYYPPEGQTKNDCPVSGVFGMCTQVSLSHFQKANGISDESSFGIKTRQALNSAVNKI